MGFFGKLFGGLKKTATAISSGISAVFSGRTFDDEFYDELEDIMLLADMGFSATEEIIKELKTAVKKERIKTEEDLRAKLSQIIQNILQFDAPPMENKGTSPSQNVKKEVILIVGVNGVGKTTTIGKLAHIYKEENLKPLLISADTFRAAATEQLTEWASRNSVRLVKQGEGADPASVVFDGLVSFNAKEENVAIIDTAGRLHNKVHLMEELKRIDKTVKKVLSNAPNEVTYKKLLVIDATTGGNALSQIEYFDSAVGLDGIILTKLDGTAKGGIIVAIKKQFSIPVLFVGIGESIGDLIPFNPEEFVRAIIEQKN
ncbi:MAG: signal recognition particle-docking protein FtsY [Christensenellaceae bacterium]|jgi:fused signal recognition particle receptor|nr:signal recognition particle-docking protein FtsY [Christensenellaceae bacterium]